MKSLTFHGCFKASLAAGSYVVFLFSISSFVFYDEQPSDFLLLYFFLIKDLFPSGVVSLSFSFSEGGFHKAVINVIITWCLRVPLCDLPSVPSQLFFLVSGNFPLPEESISWLQIQSLSCVCASVCAFLWQSLWLCVHYWLCIMPVHGHCQTLVIDGGRPCNLVKQLLCQKTLDAEQAVHLIMVQDLNFLVNLMCSWRCWWISLSHWNNPLIMWGIHWSCRNTLILWEYIDDVGIHWPMTMWEKHW